MDVREKLVEILKQAPFEGKVLDAGRDLLRLHALHKAASHHTGKAGIFRIIFKVSAAQRTSVNIDRRR